MKVSRSAALLGHVAGILEEHGHTVDTLTLRDLPAEALMHADFEHPATSTPLRGWRRRTV